MHKRFSFLFSGGIRKSSEWDENSASVKFMALLLIPKSMKGYYHEEFLSSAVRHNLLVDGGPSRPPETINAPYSAGHLHAYTTDLPYVKIFASRTRPGRGTQYLSFFIQLGRFNPRKTITIFPFGREPATYLFHAEGRILKKLEALELLEEDSVGYKILKQQSYNNYPKAVLKEMVEITTEEEKVISTTRRIIGRRVQA